MDVAATVPTPADGTPAGAAQGAAPAVVFDWRSHVAEAERPVVAVLRQRAGERLRGSKLDADFHLARFARARKLDADKAWAMLDETLTWRERERIDTLSEWWAPTDVAKRIHAYYPLDLDRPALDDRPMLIDCFSHVDPTAFMSGVCVVLRCVAHSTDSTSLSLR